MRRAARIETMQGDEADEYVEGARVDYDKELLGGGMSYGLTVEFAADAFGYNKLYYYTHKGPSGARRLFTLNNYRTLEHMIAAALGHNGVHVNEVVLGKLRSGTDEVHIDFSLKCVTTMERHVRERYGVHVATIESIDWDVEITSREKQVLLELSGRMSPCILQYLSNELDVEVERYRLAKGRYQLLPINLTEYTIKIS